MLPHRRSGGWTVWCTLLLGAALLWGALASAAAAHDVGQYEAEIRRTAYGIPHIKAADYAGLGFGAGYAFAEDNLCVLADSIVTASAERAKFFGGSPTNIASDLFFQWMKANRFVEDILAGNGQFPPPSQEARDLVAGFAAGYNQYLAERGVDHVADPTCRGEAWVRPIDDLDLWRHYYKLMTGAGWGAFVQHMLAATPPEADAVVPADSEVLAGVADAWNDVALFDVFGNSMASNAYALGRDATVNGTGMLLANPHYPWHGERRFYRQHLTIPGELNVTGASIFGLPVINFGHNETAAWTHTVATSQRYTLYRLQLVPGSPTTYLYDGEPREMIPRTVTITVQVAPDVFAEYSHTFWETHYGPVIQNEQMPWTPTTAFTIRDVNADNLRALDLWLDINRAASVREIEALLDYYQGMPWVNTIAADAFGEVFYGDHSVVPHVTAAKMAECGWPVLDGSRSACEWGSDPDAAVPGIFGPSNLPTLVRTDYVSNMNNSYWLSNPEAPLTGFSPIIGSENSNIGLRARLGLLMIEERLNGSDGMPGTKFTLEQLQTVMFNNRHYGGELVRDDLVALCLANPSVTMEDGAVVDISEACDVLADWDLRVDVDSRGAHIFHEFARQGGLRFKVPFDVADPINTPHTLNTDDPAVLAALAGAVRFLGDNNIPLDAAWGDVQNVTRAGQVIPIHGGSGGHGVFNAISSRFVDGVGYAEVSSGASIVIVVEFTEDGPVSRAILAYSQSVNPESPHYADQTVLYSQKQWLDLKFDEDEILSDPELRVYTVRSDRLHSTE